MRQVLVSFFLMAMLAVLAGCTGGEAPPPAAPEPKAAPEPTPDQIAKEIRGPLGVLQEALVAGTPPPDSSTFLPTFSSTVAKHRATENGKTAIAQVAREVEELIRQCKEKKRWMMVKTGIDVYEALVPNSSKYNRLKETADLEASKPGIKLKAFFVDHAANNQVYAFLELTYFKTGEVKNVQVREGEEFENMRFIRIVGDLKGVELEYLPIPGDTFEVMKQK